MLVGYASTAQLQVFTHSGANTDTTSSDEQSWCDLGWGLGAGDSNITGSLWGHPWEAMNQTPVRLSHNYRGDLRILSALHALDSLGSLGSLRLGNLSSLGSPRILDHPSCL